MNEKQDLLEQIKILKAERDKYERDAIVHRVKVEELKEERDAAFVAGLEKAGMLWHCDVNTFTDAIAAEIERHKAGE